MQIGKKFLLFFGVSFVFSQVFAEEFVVNEASPLILNKVLGMISTFKVENSGPIQVIEGEGSTLVLRAELLGLGRAVIQYNEVEPGKIKIEMKTLPLSEEDRNLSQLDKLKESSDKVRRLWGAGKHLINGTMGIRSAAALFKEGDTPASEGFRQLRLILRVPRSLLGHISLQTDDGSLILKGTFKNDFSDTRVVLVKSVNGNIKVLDIEAKTVGALSEDSVIELKNIKAEKIEAYSELTNIIAQDNEGDLSARSDVGGNITVTGHLKGQINAFTVYGDIIFGNPHLKGSQQALSVEGRHFISGSVNQTCEDLLKKNSTQYPFMY